MTDTPESTNANPNADRIAKEIARRFRSNEIDGAGARTLRASV